MANAVVSIIMPAYNAERTIKASIASVLAQTYADWQLIIINDASTDATAEIARKAAEEDGLGRVILLTNEVNSGISASRNRGIRQAKGIWLAFLDSDDLWREDKLEKQLHFMEECGAVISYTATAYMNAEGRQYDYILPTVKRLSYKQLLKRNLLSCSSVMVRRDAMATENPFPQGRLHEDYAVWLDIVKKAGHAHGLNEPLLVYRMAKGSKSSARLSSAAMTYAAYRQHGFGKPTAALLTLRYAVHSISKRLRISLFI